MTLLKASRLTIEQEHRKGIHNLDVGDFLRKHCVVGSEGLWRAFLNHLCRINQLSLFWKKVIQVYCPLTLEGGAKRRKAGRATQALPP